MAYFKAKIQSSNEEVCPQSRPFRIGKGRGFYRVLVRKLVGKTHLGRLSHRWEDNIKMDLQDMGCGCVDWISVAHDRGR
jgi:hypothetical protein